MTGGQEASPSSGIRVEAAQGVLPRFRLDAVIPVYNEEHVLAGSVERLRAFLAEHMGGYRWRIVVADNASIDGTLAVAEGLAAAHPNEVALVHLLQKGRGRALRHAWLNSDADILSYMDVDLSTDLSHYPLLIQCIVNGYDVATGSRLLPESKTNRSPKREFISRSYNLITKLTHFTKIVDMQCGFKALSRRAAQELIPLVENNQWFFDTELLLLAEKFGYRIKEIPVQWLEDPDTRVKIVATVMEDLHGLVRLRLHPPARPAAANLD
ncbi:MAG: glycosyltransferase family 2 protein [Dehalococcoidia bacterium]|nr:glycosyltransferase family 2 protein [Dehalococcoidia bacterium]